MELERARRAALLGTALVAVLLVGYAYGATQSTSQVKIAFSTSAPKCVLEGVAGNLLNNVTVIISALPTNLFPLHAAYGIVDINTTAAATMSSVQFGSVPVGITLNQNLTFPVTIQPDAHVWMGLTISMASTFVAAPGSSFTFTVTPACA